MADKVVHVRKAMGKAVDKVVAVIKVVRVRKGRRKQATMAIRKTAVRVHKVADKVELKAASKVKADEAAVPAEEEVRHERREGTRD